jgi:uncharacterized protein (DUF1810 family)
MTTTNERPFQNLRRFNLFMGLFHFAQGLLMLALSNLDFKLPVTTAFLKYDETTDKLVSNLKTAFDLPLAPLVAAFLFMSALAHFLISTPGIYDWYVRNLKKGVNYARWMEYAFSSSVMIVAIAMLFGMYDIATLLLIFTLNATMILFGWMMELHNQTTEKTDWTAFIFGSIAGIVPWIAIGIYLIGSVTSGEQVPNFVYAIYVSLFPLTWYCSTSRLGAGRTISTGKKPTSCFRWSRNRCWPGRSSSARSNRTEFSGYQESV